MCDFDCNDIDIVTPILFNHKKSEIHIGYVVGQGYGGAVAMFRIKNKEQKHTQNECPAAVQTRCAAHSLRIRP